MTLEWTRAAERTLVTYLHPRVAQRLAEALTTFARTSRGPVATIPDSHHLRILVRGAGAELLVDERADTVVVLRVFRRGA